MNTEPSDGFRLSEPPPASRGLIVRSTRSSSARTLAVTLDVAVEESFRCVTRVQRAHAVVDGRPHAVRVPLGTEAMALDALAGVLLQKEGLFVEGYT